MKTYIHGIILSWIIAFWAGFAQAEMTIVNPGSQEGAFRQVLTTLGEKVDHKFIQANNPVTASAYMENDNILTIWSSEWPGNSDIDSPKITGKNLVALMTYETLMCSREFKSLDSMKGKTVKIATWGSDPVAKFLKNLGKQYKINFVVVPFSGSGSTTKGYLGMDANTVFTITTKQNALLEDKATTCYAFSEKGDLGFRFVDAIITVNANQNTTDDLRVIVDLLSEQQPWQDKFSGTSTYIGEGYLPMFEEAVVNFSN